VSLIDLCHSKKFAKRLLLFLHFLGEWKINEVKPSEKGDSQEVKVKVRINSHGVLVISNAQMVERKEVPEAEQNGAEQEAAAPQSPTTGQPPEAGAAAPPTGEPMETQEVSLRFSYLIRVD